MEEREKTGLPMSETSAYKYENYYGKNEMAPKKVFLHYNLFLTFLQEFQSGATFLGLQALSPRL